MPEPYQLSRYEEAFAKALGMPYAYGFYKGRVALYAILRALGVSPGDIVIFPGFTCIMVPNAALYLGARPVYVDIDPATYNMDPARLKDALSSMSASEMKRVKAVVVQHTFGIPADMDAIAGLANDLGVPVVEDCAHSLGSKLGGRLTGTMGTASFFSSQWSKPYSTGLGGMAATADAALAQKLGALQGEFARPGGLKDGLLGFQVRLHRRLFSARMYWTAVRALRMLSAAGLFIGSSSRDEYGEGRPAGYEKVMGEAQAQAGLDALAGVRRDIAHRRKVSEFYTAELGKKGLKLGLPRGSDPVLLRYPVVVKDKDAALSEAKHRSAELGSWFETVLHPSRKDLGRAGYVPGSCPAGEEAAKKTVNLPTHPRVGQDDAKRSLSVAMKFMK